MSTSDDSGATPGQAGSLTQGDGARPESTSLTGLDEADGPARAMSPAFDEHEVVRWLLQRPDFLAQHPDVLSTMRLPSPHEGRAISFQDRQIELLRERLRGLERKLGELIHIGRDNEAISLKMLHWVRSLLTADSAEELPSLVVEAMRTEFVVPLVALRLWRVDPLRVDARWLEGVSSEQVAEVDRMPFPYCGPCVEQSCRDWLPEAGRDARSMALIPLRRGVEPASFGLLVLGSGDADRFHTGMGTAFLERIAEIASAALGRLVEGAPAS